MSRKIIASLAVIAGLVSYLVISGIRCPGDIPKLEPWSGSADEISIIGPGTAVSLVKSEGKWLVGERRYPADAKLIADLEKKFKELRLVSLVSRKGFFNRYDLTPDKYREVTVKKNGRVFRKYMIGKTGSTGKHTYVRIGDTPSVYLVEGTFEQELSRGVDEYRDREILKISNDAISSIEISYLGRKHVFDRVAEKAPPVDPKTVKRNGPKIPPKSSRRWICAACGEGFEVDQNRLDAIAMTLNPLAASAFIDVQKESLKNPMCTVTIKAFGKEIVLSVFGKKDNRYLAACSESPFVFSLDEWRVNGFFLGGPETFKKRPEAGR